MVTVVGMDGVASERGAERRREEAGRTRLDGCGWMLALVLVVLSMLLLFVGVVLVLQNKGCSVRMC